jgi:uncharacterized protein YyaL (SSP411 family)
VLERSEAYCEAPARGVPGFAALDALPRRSGSRAGTSLESVPNRLAGETSPYLLQHKDNPVDWYPWGEEALARARAVQRPLLISIGYSACHWCHVMAHESFEDERTAALMNERFVCVKVDREERPDVDAIYMEACQAMTGQGGWPLNAFLTPEQVPFYVGTYFPPSPRHGMPSWRQVLAAVAEAWEKRRDEVLEQSGRMIEALSATARIEPSAEAISEEMLAQAIERLRFTGYDERNGGWGGAPKFPAASAIELLLARGEHERSLQALRAMAAGGIHDQIGGGFHRYAVDSHWTVPHFEKMLYDNALLARAYLHGWLVSGEPRLREVCVGVLEFALRELRGAEGGFCSALDADSEGVEGKFYVWSVSELREVLGAGLAEPAIAYFGASEEGNFEPGCNVLEARGPRPERLAEIRAALLRARSSRVRPGLDDKRLTSWNALMVSALADAGAALREPRYVAAARECMEFLLAELSDGSGRMMRSWKAGQAKLNGYLEDHAHTLEALLTLYESTFDARFYEHAVALAEGMIERFADRERGGFFTTAHDHEPLIARRKDLEDSPIPSGSSAAAFGLLRLAHLSGEERYERHALSVLRLTGSLACRHPQAFAHLLQAADLHLASVREVAIIGSDQEAEAMARAARERFRPHLVLAGGASAGGASGTVPLLAGREHRGQAAAYVCERFSCRAPVHTAQELRAALDDPAVLARGLQRGG